MIEKKSYSVFSAFIVFVLFSLFNPAFSQSDRDWKTFTSFYTVNDAVIDQSTLWVATDGGVAEVNLNSYAMNYYTNTEGLAKNQIIAIRKDHNRQVIVAAGKDGSLNFYPLSSPQWSYENALTGSLINSIAITGDSLLIALQDGMAIYRLNVRSVAGKVDRLGTLPVGTPVLVVAADSKYLWCLTANALARADRYQSNFQSPSAWTVFSNSSGLNATTLLSMAVSEGRLYVSTQGQKIFRYNDSAGLFEEVTLNLPVSNYWVTSANNRLYAWNAGSVYRFQATTWNDLNPVLTDSAGNPFTILRFAGEYNQIPILVNQYGAICLIHSIPKILLPNSPRANYFSGMKFDSQGNLWFSSLSVYGFDGPGFYKFDTRNNRWDNFHSSNLNGLPTNNFQNIAIDDSGQIWLGSWAHGLAVFNPVTRMVRAYNSTNGLSPLETFCSTTITMINNVFKGPQSNIFISVNKPCDNTRALCILNTTSGNFTYYAPAKLLNMKNPFRVMLDSYGQYWITTYPVDQTTTGNGVLIIRPSNNNILDVNGATVLSISKTNGLVSNNTTAIAEDKDNVIWIGTSEGLHSYSGAVSPKYEYPNGPKGEYIRDIHVDRFNNKWFATAQGVSLLTSNGNWIHYTEENSRLVDNNILCITSDPDGRYVYFGSYDRGLSRLKNPLAATSGGEKIIAYPTPFIIGEHDRLSFLSVPDKSIIAILTINGEIVRKIEVNTLSATVDWDGKNQKGEYVASGVYLYHVYPDQSAIIRFKTKTGKIVVIRK